MKHLDDDALSAYSLDRTGVPEVETHLQECEICRDGVAFYREIDGALRGRDTWTTVDQARRQNSRLQEVLSYRRRMELEERAAHAFLARPLTSPLMFRNAKIMESAQLHTEGLVRVLCAEANSRHEQNPKFSREIAAVAYDIARTLTGTSEREQRNLMALALREHANALRYLGKFKAALKLLDHAEALFGGAGADPFDLAIVQYIRAGVFQESDRIADASRLAHEVAAVFREYGDVTRELSAVMVEACCFVYGGQPQPAVEAFERAITISRANGDVRMLARALSNCGAALKDLQDFDRAERYCIEAITLYEEFHMATEKTRAEWVLAMILLSRGKYVESARGLAAVRRQLAKLGVTNDATIATLMWAEARLAANRPSGVAQACRTLAVTFQNEDMHRYAMRALAVLNEALGAGRATSKLVHDVRVYLEDLPRNPAHPFVAIQ
jgi:tetratricopeptide (TPR) repeat protein